MEAQEEYSNSIRTYKLRGARITHSQEAAIERHWQRFGVEIGDEAIDLHALFPDLNHVVLEIGTGMGEATAEMAAADRTIGIVALEIHRPGIGSLLWRIDQAGVENVLDVLRGGIDSALLGLGKSNISELTRDDIVIPPDFLRALGTK